MIKLTLPDGSVRETEAGTTLLDVVKGMSNSLAKKALAASLDGKVVDLTTPVTKDAAFQVLTFADAGGRLALRHTCSHIMAQAVKRLYPESRVQLAIGPAIENGFYYDIDLGEGVQLKDADLGAIEAKMAEFAARKEPIIRRDITKAEVTEFFAQKGDEYKLELIADLPDGTITTYSQGEFTDLCRGHTCPIQVISRLSSSLV